MHETGKYVYIGTISMNQNYNFYLNCEHFLTTPDSSHFPKWSEVEELPLNYYRLGNLHFDGKTIFGRENGGIFEERAKFWREINAFSPNAN